MRFTIGRKLAFGFGTILVLMIASAVLTFIKVADIRRNEDQILEVRIPSLDAARNLQRDLNQTQSKGRQFILAGAEAQRREEAKKLFDQAWSDIEKDVATLDEMAPHWIMQLNRDRLAEVKSHLSPLREIQESAMARATNTQRGAIVQAGNDFADKATAAAEPIKKSLGGLADSLIEHLNINKEQLAAAQRSLAWTTIASAIFALAVGIFVAVTMSRQISRITREVLNNAEAIAAGDLTRSELRVSSGDELGDLARAVNKVNENLRSMIAAIVENSEHVASASAELSASSQQISANSEETSAQANTVSQAAQQVSQNLQGVSAGGEEMTATIQSIASNSHEAATIASKAVQTAQAANSAIGKLGKSSAEIGEVIKVITSIAQQTKLLALNATIEAARAGEAGKGFAVVANEVKELARQTAKATEDISHKITSIQADTNGAVEAIGSISSVINQVNDISGTIATAVEEQSATTNEMTRNVADAAKGSADITNNITGVACAAQGTSTSAQESQKAANDLADMAAQLRSLVEQFKVEVTEPTVKAHSAEGRVRAMAAAASR